MKAKFTILLVALMVCSCGVAYGQGLSLESVDGLIEGTTDRVTADGTTEITFAFRLTNDAYNIEGMANGIRVYSPDGATWTASSGDTTNLGWTGFNINIMDWGYLDAFGINLLSCDGSGSDTVGFGGAILSNCSGVPAGLDTVAYFVTIGPIATTDHGKTICLDSTYYPPTGYWLWAGPNGSVNPSWDGPHCYTITDPAQDVQSLDGALPTSFDLQQNYPNPFNPTTDIKFDVPTRSLVKISIFNVLGQMTRELVNEDKEAGSYVVDWDGTSDGGAKVSSGIYFYRMEAGSYVETKKMMLLK